MADLDGNEVNKTWFNVVTSELAMGAKPLFAGTQNNPSDKPKAQLEKSSFQMLICKKSPRALATSVLQGPSNIAFEHPLNRDPLPCKLCFPFICVEKAMSQVGKM